MRRRRVGEHGEQFLGVVTYELLLFGREFRRGDGAVLTRRSHDEPFERLEHNHQLAVEVLAVLAENALAENKHICRG